MADGTPILISVLKQGDAIRVLDQYGLPTTDTVSDLSLAQLEATANFLTLSTVAGANLTLTPEHHVPVGATCCATLKKAKDVSIGDTVYQQLKAGAIVATTIKQKSSVQPRQGLHSPVMTHGTYPIVNDVATAFDSGDVVVFASYALPLVEATYTTNLLRRFFLPPGKKYIEA